MSYYTLKKHANITWSDNRLNIDNLEGLRKSITIENDVVFNELKNQKGYFLLSGGGTYFINERYIAVIKRDKNAKVNPSKISFFTGRSDSLHEILNPDLLLRELFEELIISKENTLLYPTHAKYQFLIDRVYKNLKRDGIITFCKEQKMNLELLATHKLISFENIKEYNMDFYINSSNDINVFNIFKINIENISKISLKDGEYHYNNGKKVMHDRKILLLDLKEDLLWNLEKNEKEEFDISDATEHLLYIYKKLKEKVLNENNCRILSKS